MGKASGTTGRAPKMSRGTTSTETKKPYDANAGREQMLNAIKALGYNINQDLDFLEIRTSKIFKGHTDQETDDNETKRVNFIDEMKRRAGYEYSYEYVEGEGKTENIPTSLLIPTQYGVIASGLTSAARYAPNTEGGSNGRPAGFRVKGEKQVYIIDGHHRAATNILRGDKHLTMRIVEVSKSDFKKYFKK